MVAPEVVPEILICRASKKYTGIKWWLGDVIFVGRKWVPPPKSGGSSSNSGGNPLARYNFGKPASGKHTQNNPVVMF